MRGFTNILYSPSSRSHDPEALARVVALAQRNDATVTLLGVVPQPTPLQHLFDRHGAIEVAQRAARKELLDRLTRWSIAAHHAKIEAVIAVGQRDVEIIAQVRQNDHDLVVLNDPSYPHSTTVKRLVGRCPCPVWVIRPSPNDTRHVLAAVRPFLDELALNLRILELASSMVASEGGDLHVVHAWEVYGDCDDHGSLFTHTPPIDFETLRRETRSAHRDALEELLEAGPTPDVSWQIHLEQGPPEEAIAQIARRSAIDLLVMGASGRRGIEERSPETRRIECSTRSAVPWSSPRHRTSWPRSPPTRGWPCEMRRSLTGGRYSQS